MTKQQKQETTKFMERVLVMLTENGTWIWPENRQAYTKMNGKLVGTGYAIELIKDITLPSFHSKLQKL